MNSELSISSKNPNVSFGCLSKVPLILDVAMLKLKYKEKSVAKVKKKIQSKLKKDRVILILSTQYKIFNFSENVKWAMGRCSKFKPFDLKHSDITVESKPLWMIKFYGVQKN